MDLQALGKLMLAFAAIMALVGGALWIAGALGLGSLPGDLRFSGRQGSLFIPITTSIVISIVLTVLLNVAIRLFGSK